MSRPQVSLITAHSPGREAMLPEAYGSLLKQSEASWQWIIESEEGMPRPEWVSEDRRIIWEENPDGLAVAIKRNHALLLSEGDYLCILDDDDALPPDSLELRLAAFEKFPEAGFVMGDAGLLGDPEFAAESPPYPEGLVAKGEVYQAWKRRKEAGIAGVIPAPNAILWKREVLWQIAGWHALRKGEDTAMMIHASLLFPAVYLNQTVYLLREHEGRLTRDKSRVPQTIAWIQEMAESILASQKKAKK